MNKFTVCHITKYNASHVESGALGRHIDRSHTPANVNQERSTLNFELTQTHGSLRQDIEKRISEGYTSKRKIRANTVRSVGFILSGSHEQMKSIESQGNIKKWAFESYRYIAEQFGEENIVRAIVHMDEKTPHMHLQLVPITTDGRLSAKELLTKEKLQEIQDTYAERMRQFGLERGITGSKRKHITTKQFYRYVNENELDATKLLSHTNAKELVGKALELAQSEDKEKNKSKQVNTQKKNYYERKIHARPPKRRGGKERSGGEEKQGNSGFER